MKPILIKIDLKSIKKNKDAGSMQSNICSGKNIKFIASKLPYFFIEDENCYINSISKREDGVEIFEGIILNPELVDRLINEKVGDISINITRDIVSIFHDPVPQYSYKYKNSKIKCNSCKQSFNFEELRSDEIEYFDEDGNDEGYGYSDRVCPKCGTWDCCELGYETIESALKRKKK